MPDFSAIIDKNQIFRLVSAGAAELGVDAYVVGGFVRDLLLERPSKDIDVVCVGSGIALAKAVANMMDGQPKVVTFKNFGTAMLQHGDWEVEFVGARKESYRRDSRKPIVEDGSLQDDQLRRDFTINAMAIGLNKQDFGQLIDPFDGQADLKRKVMRTPLDPQVTFSDDPLRMMRAVRFASQLNFDIVPDTFDAIVDNCQRIDIVSMERVVDELNKVICSPVPSYGFKLLFHTGLLPIIFPEFVELKGVETKNGHSHKDNFYHTLQVLDNLAEVSGDLWHRWTAVLHDIAKPATKRYDEKVGWTFHGHEERGARMVPKIFRRLKLPLNEKMKYVQKLVRLHLRPIALVKKSITDTAIRRLIYEAGNDLEDLMALCKADITSKNHQRVQRYLENFDSLEGRIKMLEARDSIRNFQPVVTGEIIMETFGLKPSKEVGQLKSLIREAILEGEIRNHYPEAYGYLLAHGQEMGFQVVKKVPEPPQTVG